MRTSDSDSSRGGDCPAGYHECAVAARAPHQELAAVGPSAARNVDGGVAVDSDRARRIRDRTIAADGESSSGSIANNEVASHIPCRRGQGIRGVRPRGGDILGVGGGRGEEEEAES